MRAIALSLVLALWACGNSGTSKPAAPAQQQAAAEGPVPLDQSRHFPQAGQVNMELVPRHLLSKSFMPGGNLATYRSGKIEYRQFLGKMPDAQSAAFLLLDWKKALMDAQYLAHMGGYFGMDRARPVYVFTKGAWVAGIEGLPRQKADAVAREFAARL